MVGVYRSNSQTGGSTENWNFRSTVQELSNGGILLVVSKGPDWLHRQCCQQLLGDTADPRLRVLGVPGGADGTDPGAVTDRLPEGASTAPEALRIVYNDIPNRGGVGTDPGTTSVESKAHPFTGNGPDGHALDIVRALSNAPIGEFGHAIHEAIGDLVSVNGGDVADGELRVGVENLEALIHGNNTATVARLLYLLGTRVKTAGGLMHAHVSTGAESHPVQTFAPFVDGVVYLRVRNGEAQMQWGMNDGPTSEWIPLNWIGA